MSTLARLIVTAGPDRGRAFDVGDEMAHIGRDLDAHIVLSDPDLAEHQASIAHRSGRFALFSPHPGGAFVDGAEVPPERWVWLPTTADIQFGLETSLRFETANGSPPVPTALSLDDLLESAPAVTEEENAPYEFTEPAAAVSPPPLKEEQAQAARKDGSSNTVRRRRKKGEPKRQVARLSVDATTGAPTVQLGADGRLPEFHLSDKPTREAVDPREAPVRPWLAILAVGTSALVSLLLLLWSPETGRQGSAALREARSRLTQFYGQDGTELEEYQRLLRKAAIEHSQGRFGEERRVYLRVLDMLNSTDVTNPRNLHGLTGRQTRRGRNGDRELREALEQLIAQ